MTPATADPPNAPPAPMPGVAFVRDLAARRPAAEFVEKIPIAFARRHGVLGLAAEGADGSDGGGAMTLVLREWRDARDLRSADVVSRLLGRPVVPALAPAEDLAAAIDAAYQQRTGEAQGLIEHLERRDVLAEVRQLGGREDLLDVASRAPVIKLVNLVLFEAVKLRASDVHVQPYEDRLVVRTRIDGVLSDAFDVPKNLQDEVVSRMKVMGRMNIAEKRVAQDGRATVRVGGRSIDLRLATLPTSFGERVVVRLLDKGTRPHRLGELGMDPATLARFRGLVAAEHGIVLVTGPTGGGKTTTLYAALGEIDAKRRNILTLEDPIEYGLEGVSQTQVSDKKGMTFAGGLRSVLRQDPDIIMVGEIRDHETAVMAIQSALTGHLVFSTLHTNDAAGAVARLLDLGIEPYLLASSLIGVLAQRLVRRVCPDCGRPAVPTADDLRRLGGALADADTGRMRAGGGCAACRNTGYLGRAGIFELLALDDAVAGAIQRRAAAPEIKAAAMTGGMTTLRADGLGKVLAGLTTVDEVMRVTAA